MDPTVKRLATPEECDQYIENVVERHPALASEAMRRKIQLAARLQAPVDDCEAACYAAILAYEEVMFRDRGKRVRAARTWQKISKVGLLGAVEDWVTKPYDPTGYKDLERHGLLEHTFEAVVVRYPERFSPEALDASRNRLSRIASL
jgi:hypothetical protein